jgi:hypothetical protein
MMWDPQQYLRYQDERSRPFYDLVSQVEASLGGAPRAVAQIGRTPKDGQMAQGHPSVMPVQPIDPLPTPPTGSSCPSAFDGNDQFPAWIDLRFENSHVRNVQRYGHLCLRHNPLLGQLPI